MVLEHEDFELVGVFDPCAKEKNLNENAEYKDTDVPVYVSREEIKTDAEVWIDFTAPSAVFENAKFALENHISPVIGTTGMSDDQVAELQALAKKEHVGGLIAPNFGISAVLLMQFAKKAAEYLPDVEIIEMHHDNKLDAPSGTAINTAKMIAEVRKAHKQGKRIHAVRLPGYVAHEQVLFGGKGEALTIRQDSFDRISFMSGVAVATEKIRNYDELMIGLENLL